MPARTSHGTLWRIGALALALAACDLSGSTEVAQQPTMDQVAGSYLATQFTTTTNGTATNQLQHGAVIAIVLTASGATTGRLVVPDQAVNADLTGSWRLAGTTVTFTHTTDTFLRDMPFTVVGNTLVGDATFSGTRMQVTLTRQ